MPRVDALLSIGAASKIAERIATEFADEADFAAQAGSGNGLIGTFSSWTKPEVRAEHGFAPLWQTLGAEGEVSDKAAHHSNPFARHLRLTSAVCIVRVA